jgi:hypothetical protein
MAYHLNTLPNLIAYRGLKKVGGWGDWALGSTIEKACRKHSNTCLHLVPDDFGDMDMGACVWCKTQSVGCSIALHHRQGVVSKERMEEKPRVEKRKVSMVDESKDSEGEVPSPRKVKSCKIIVDSKEEEWLGGREEWVKRDPETGKSAKEAWASLPSNAEIEGADKEKDKGKSKVKWVRKSERLEVMRELVLPVRELGSKVDRFADEVRVLDVLRNWVDREYLEMRR